MKRVVAIVVFNLIFTIQSGPDLYAQVDKTGKKPNNKNSVSTWHWASQSEPMGINFVVNDPEKAKKVIESYRRDHITRVYGGYLRMASTPGESNHLKQWNRRLNEKNISSIYLLGSPKWIYPEYRDDMITMITNNYIDFNSGLPKEEQLKGIHLDIEVHALPEWKSATTERKREMMQLLLETWQDVRTLLIENGRETDEIMADVPFWYDSEEAVGWESADDRKRWFDAASGALTGISIMDYETSSVSQLLVRTEWERKNFNGIVEIGLNSEEIGTTWKNRDEFRKTLAALRSATQGPVAVHRYLFVLKIPGNPLVGE